VPTVNEDEVVSALNNLGYPRKTARSMAQAAIQDNPHDFDAALKQAISGKSVSGAKAAAIEDAGEEARRGGPGAPPAPDASKTYVRPSKMGTPQGIADQVKAAKTGKTAETQARVEQHKVAKKEIGEETKASVPMMVTKQMEADLKTRGYSQAEIDKMTPAEANARLKDTAATSAKTAQNETDDWAQAKNNLGLPPDAPYSAKISAEATRIKAERLKKAKK
jgi:Holliday junction resolvase RuvA-like protein